MSFALALPPVSPPAHAVPLGVRGADTLEALETAAALIDDHRYADALDVLGHVNVPAVSAPALALRVLLTDGWARLYLGDLAGSEISLERARALSEGTIFSDLDRAHAMFRLGCCRQKLGRTSNAVSLFTVALGLAERGGHEGAALRGQLFEWRSRCYQLQREWDAAQTDAERALELAHTTGDIRLEALAQMQCSLVAERMGETLMARLYAERARTLAAEGGDRQTEARLLNNLGGLSFLLGEPEVAVAYLKESFALSLELGNDADAAQAISSLAQVHLRCGAPLLAEEQARHALSLLDGRTDYTDERGNAQLVLGRALLAQDRHADAMLELTAGERLFESLGSAGHLAAAWLAQGDAHRAAGELEQAASQYRRAADALQDVHF